MEEPVLTLIIFQQSIPIFLFIIMIVLSYIGYKRTRKNAFILLLLMGIFSVIGSIAIIYANILLILGHNVWQAYLLASASGILNLAALVLLVIATYLFAYERE